MQRSQPRSWSILCACALSLGCNGGDRDETQGSHDAGPDDSGSTPPDDAGADAGPSSALHWYESCGAPVCGVSPEPYNSPTIRDCTDEKLGGACGLEGDRCDGVLGCGATLICATSDPTMRPGGCPISRARYKEDVAYLSEAELRAFHEQLLRLPLASYRYKHAPGAGPQLGFMIDDVEPSVAVSGDHVNMYGYLSMAVAAIQVQQRQIEALQTELRRQRARRPPRLRPSAQDTPDRLDDHE